MNEKYARMALRAIAVVIAATALIDPLVSSTRSVKPEIALVTANDVADAALASRVAEQLSRLFTVISAPFADAAATVIVGNHVPSDFREYSAPIFAVAPDTTGTQLTIESISTPQRAPLDARVPVIIVVNVRGAKGKAIDAHLVLNDVSIDALSPTVTTDVARLEIPLSFVPTANGVVSVRAVARVHGESDSSSASAVVEIREKKWAVLFFDTRPSWMSTFVRRATERDVRFVVTSRVNTSTNVSTDAGRPPASLSDAMVNELYDAIVVGAPESLSERDADGLENFMRRRGGSVVLLFDQLKSGKYERLVDFGAWKQQTNSQPTIIAAASDTIAMRASEWMWPSRLPATSTVLARSNVRARDSSTAHPIVWTASVGAGRLIVSTALDAWKFRDSKQSGFDKFWQTVIGDAASASPAAIELRLPSTIIHPGSLNDITLTSRAASLAELKVGRAVHSSASVSLASPTGSSTIRMWPDGAPGVFHGSLRAPTVPGVYRITASADGATTEGSLVVASHSPRSNPAALDLLSAVAESNGGHLIFADKLDQLTSEINRSLRAGVRRVAWYPMRSAWWIVPFALALAAEWWLRRRSGLA